ncbi:hypothetical protein DYB35_010280 [Aphanomyces astaci]|uniref:DDE-1 domain-containing protein n=2 Tax=Aphanomyces astaci TaxID=112090 RepID=A0A418DSJ7_APHAT|nr:hypothetical protein DYB35_010280 [Aphanomyces astaci]
MHIITWIKRNQRPWLLNYLVTKKSGSGYNSILHTKLPIMFIMKGQPGGCIESLEIPTFPAGHFYAVQEKACMDAHVWKEFLRSVLYDDIEECSVVLVDNFESHVSEESINIVNEELGSHLFCTTSKHDVGLSGVGR